MITPKEGAGLLERATRGPWHVFHKNHVLEVQAGAKEPVVHWSGFDAADQKPAVKLANAELIALAPDHALLLRALTTGKATLGIGYLDDAGKRFIHVEALTLEIADDAAGCPALTPELRSALRKVVGSNG